MLAELIASTAAEARPYQERVIQKTYDAFTKTGVKSCMIESPAGSGKTCMGMIVARLLQQEYNLGVGWVAMRRNLLSQAERTNRDLRLGVDDPQFISMFDKHPPLQDNKGRPIGLLITDEAHHDCVSSMTQLYSLIKPRFTLGLSATPYRTDSVKLCFNKIIKDAGIHTLISQGYLSQYHQYTIPEYTVENVIYHNAERTQGVTTHHGLAASRQWSTSTSTASRSPARRTTSLRRLDASC